MISSLKRGVRGSKQVENVCPNHASLQVSISSCSVASSLGGYQVSILPEHGKVSSILSVMRMEPKVGRLTLKGNKESPEGAEQEHNP